LTIQHEEHDIDAAVDSQKFPLKPNYRGVPPQPSKSCYDE